MSPASAEGQATSSAKKAETASTSHVQKSENGGNSGEKRGTRFLKKTLSQKAILQAQGQKVAYTETLLDT